MSLFYFKTLLSYTIFLFLQQDKNFSAFENYIKMISDDQIKIVQDGKYILVPKVICEGCVDYSLIKLQEKSKNQNIFLISSNFHIYNKYKLLFKKTFYDKNDKMSKQFFSPILMTIVIIKDQSMKIYHLKSSDFKSIDKFISH